MNMGSFRLALQRSLKHFLSGDIFTAIKLDDTAVVQRVSISRQHAVSAEASFRDGKVCASSGGNFRYLCVSFKEDSKLISRLLKSSASEFTMGAVKCMKRSRLIYSRLSRWRRSYWFQCTDGANRCMSLFDSCWGCCNARRRG